MKHIDTLDLILLTIVLVASIWGAAALIASAIRSLA